MNDLFLLVRDGPSTNLHFDEDEGEFEEEEEDTKDTEGVSWAEGNPMEQPHMADRLQKLWRWRWKM